MIEIQQIGRNLSLSILISNRYIQAIAVYGEGVTVNKTSFSAISRRTAKLIQAEGMATFKNLFLYNEDFSGWTKKQECSCYTKSRGGENASTEGGRISNANVAIRDVVEHVVKGFD